MLFSLILGRKKLCLFVGFFFYQTSLYFFFSIGLNVYVCEQAGSALQLLSAEEKPVRCQGSQEEGSRHISIFISFSGTFVDLSYVSLLYRVCSGSLVLASCLLTTFAALMVGCGKISTISSLSVCACASHSSGSGAET